MVPRAQDKQGSTCCESWASIGLLDEPVPGAAVVSEPRVPQDRGDGTRVFTQDVCAEMHLGGACWPDFWEDLH